MGMEHKDVVLIQMPNTWLHPSLALGLLKADLNQAGLSNEVIYASHHYVQWLGSGRYLETDRLMELYYGAWEMLFAPFTDFTPRTDAREMLSGLWAAKDDKLYIERGIYKNAEEKTKKLLDGWDDLSRDTDAFLDHEAELILRKTPKIVGFSIMTQQRNAALALMKRLKARDPGIITILGGGCCGGEAGPAFLRAAPSLDYCFSGDGDLSLGEGCRLLLEGKTEELRQRFPEFLSRGDAPVNRVLQDMNTSLIPDFTEYFEQIRNEAFINPAQIRLTMEGSRGCWWGEKGRCRFCGLHVGEEALRYRSKTPERFFAEALTLSERYGVSNFVLTDTNLDLKLIRSLPEKAPKERAHLNFFAECKSNLRAHEVRRLKNNGFHSLQAGIESLSDEILDLMHKGAKTVHQLAFLKYARQYKVKAYWNIMYALPGERVDWYEEMLTLISHLHFLDPPTGLTAMQLVRNSVFWEEHEAFGMKTVRPRINEDASDPDEAFTLATSNAFICPDMRYIPGITEKVWDAVAAWRKDFREGSKLLLVSRPDMAVIRDLRVPGTKKIYQLRGLRRKLYEMAYEVVSEKETFRRLQGAEGDGASPEEIEEALAFFTERFLLYRKGGRLLSLAIPTEDPV